MRANLYMQFNVPDDYKPGDCSKCPLASKSYFDNHYVEEKLSCKAGYTPITCPAFLSTNDLIRQQCESIEKKEGGAEE